MPSSALPISSGHVLLVCLTCVMFDSHVLKQPCLLGVRIMTLLSYHEVRSSYLLLWCIKVTNIRANRMYERRNASAWCDIA